MFNLFNNTSNNLSNQNKQQNKIATQNVENFETLQNARQDLIGEIEAIMQYDNHIRMTNDRLARETWENIKSEELTHVGELLALLNHLDPSQRQYVEQGINEFNERMNMK